MSRVIPSSSVPSDVISYSLHGPKSILWNTPATAPCQTTSDICLSHRTWNTIDSPWRIQRHCASYFVSSNRILPSVHTSSGIFVELQKVIQSAGMCDLWVLHMFGGLRSMSTLACRVSVEILPYFCWSLLHVTQVRNLLRHIHVAQGLVSPFAKLSSRLTAQLCDVKFSVAAIHCSRWLLQGSRQVITRYGSILSSSVSLLESGRVESGLRLFSVSSSPF